MACKKTANYCAEHHLLSTCVRRVEGHAAIQLPDSGSMDEEEA